MRGLGLAGLTGIGRAQQYVITLYYGRIGGLSAAHSVCEEA